MAGNGNGDLNVIDIAKGKIQTRPLDDNPAILDALRKII